MRATLSLIAVVLAIAGCGYKTPLTLPAPKPGAQQPSPPPTAQPVGKKPGDEPDR